VCHSTGERTLQSNLYWPETQKQVCREIQAINWHLFVAGQNTAFEHGIQISSQKVLKQRLSNTNKNMASLGENADK